MSSVTGSLSKLSAIKLALASSEARAKLELGNVEPLAIIGAGCRFPGNAASLEAFWELLKSGTDAITEVPAERWDPDAFYDPNPAAPGKMTTRCGGFAENLQEFDADFFGISPREAVSLDPQQRTLLEVTWETLENAGLAPDTLAGTNTGVFVGISGIDYLLHLEACNYEIDAYVGTGNALSVSSGRLSYLLGLQGPSISVDTACSSSLVAVHMACQSLRNRECDQALAGGTHRILLPHGSIGLSQSRLLAPDGRSKTFDSRADGYVRGEGCGMILLKRLSDAIADEDNILALIRGTAVNQDGKTSGLTVPNGPAQQAVIRKALRNGGVDAGQVGYVEAHGTGTPLGDPIEVAALGAVFGQQRQGPLIIGSVKTNFGHLEASAGIAGLLKVALALHYREIPPHLHFQRPSPHIPWQNLPLQVATRRMPWPVIDGRRIGGVSSFGFSGTNAHAVLEETPAELVTRQDAAERNAGPHLLTISAKTPQALQALAERYQEHLAAHPEQAFEDVCYTSCAGRTHLAQRLAIVAECRDEARCSLQSWLSGVKGDSRCFEGRRTKAPGIGFVFSGDPLSLDTSGYPSSQREVVRRTLEQADTIAAEYLDGKGVALASSATSFAVQVALAEMWRGLGIEPGVLAGWGIGRFAAACVAGVFRFETGLRLLLRWSQVLHKPGWREELTVLTERMDFSKPVTPLISPASGKRAGSELSHPEYWIDCLEELRCDAPEQPQEKQLCDMVLGIGMTDKMLAGARQRLWLDGQTILSTLAEGAADGSIVMRNAAALYAAGASLNWNALYQDRHCRRVVLPTYPFQRKRYWVDGAGRKPEAVPVARSTQEPGKIAAARKLDKAALMAAAAEERGKLLEAYVRGQLAEILKRPEELIEHHEPLQSLGIDSLMAAELKYRIEGDLAISLDLSSVNADYTVGHVVGQVLSATEVSQAPEDTPAITLLRNAEGETVASLLTAHKGGGRIPLFFLHPGGIDISTYYGLVESLPPDQPLYVLQPHGLYQNYSGDGETQVTTSIRQAAAFCAGEVLRIWKPGAYFLAGWSLGALVAYEMTQQLKAAGHRVSILFLIDVECGPARDGSTLPFWFADLLEARSGRSLQYSFEELRGLGTDAQLERIWREAIATKAVHSAMPLNEFQFLFTRFKDALATSWLRAKEYRLDVDLCADRVVFLNSTELAKPERRAYETVFDWAAGAKEAVDVELVPGNHYTMLFEPAVQGLAKSIQRYLDQAEGRAATGQAGDFPLGGSAHIGKKVERIERLGELFGR